MLILESENPLIVREFEPGIEEENAPITEERKEIVYELMTGAWNLGRYPVKESRYVTDEFTPGNTCDKLYEQIHATAERICERLHSQDDRDVELLFMDFLSLERHLCMKMYEYGEFFAKLEEE